MEKGEISSNIYSQRFSSGCYATDHWDCITKLTSMDITWSHCGEEKINFEIVANGQGSNQWKEINAGKILGAKFAHGLFFDVFFQKKIHQFAFFEAPFLPILMG